MTRFIDLSHPFHDGMPGVTGRDREGNAKPYTARIAPILTHEESRPLYQDQSQFISNEITFQTAIGTYIDSPYVRYEDRGDVASLALPDLILPPVVMDLRRVESGQAVGLDDLTLPEDLGGKALLVNFGWDAYYGTKDYGAYPYLHRDVIDLLIARGISLLGVDTGNVDSFRDPERPAHSRLLAAGALVVENLTGLDQLHSLELYRFYALPIRAVRVGSMPVRAFVELAENGS
ncbi:MAG: cyclase family protein [Pseudomonadota bacterium]